MEVDAPGAGRPPYCNSVADLQYHLRADIIHDFKVGPAGRLTYAPPVRDGLKYDEDDVVKFFLEEQYGRITGDTTSSRKQNKVTFAIPEETAAFQAWTPPALYTTGNAKVGIVHDAGHYITNMMQAQNVLTFGSILDPAPKPVAPERNPIWFEPATNELTIPLAMFGFAPSVIGGLRVQRLTAGTVEADYVVNGATVPAIQVQDTIASNAKPINRTDVNLAGYFTSIAKAENLVTELTITRVFDNDASARAFVTANSQNFYMGKTLGDVTLVASAMEDFCGVANPYTGIGRDGAWKRWVGGAAVVSPPQVLMLKTGDRLNWVRAIIMGVGAIYEDQPKGLRNTTQYVFFPAALTEEQLVEAYTSGFDSIVADVTARYDGLRDSLNDIITSGGGAGDEETVNDNAIFVGEMQSVLRSQNGRKFGTEVVRSIQVGLNRLKDIVITWVERRKGEIVGLALDALRKKYEETRVRANACSPTARSIFIEKSGAMRIPMKIVVSNVPRLAVTTDADWPLDVSIDLPIRQAFGKLNNASATSTLDTLLAGTDLQKRFFQKIPPAPTGGQRGGADGDYDPLDLNETLMPMIAPSIALPPPTPGVRITPTYPDELGIFDEYPSIRRFATYLERAASLGQDQILDAIDNVATHMTSLACIDEVMAKNIKTEWDMLKANRDVVVNVAAVESVYTALFNAYVCCVNGRNCRGFGSAEYIDGQSERDFRAVEATFLAAYSVNVFARNIPKQIRPLESEPVKPGVMDVDGEGKHVDEIVIPESKRVRPEGAASSSGLVWGGSDLQSRRSLYGNARTSGGALPRRGLYAGLRERVGPRTTVGVRQRSSGSRTRRQRDHLD